MFKKSISTIVVFSFLLLSVGPAFAKPKGSWKDVKALVGQQVAVKNKRGKVTYGILREADDAKIKLQKAGKNSLTNNNSTFPKNDVKKVWRALLFVGKRRTGTGALIGAGAGAALGGAVLAADSSNDPLTGVAIPLFAIYGAIGGGVIGFFAKKKHKKRNLVYKP